MSITQRIASILSSLSVTASFFMVLSHDWQAGIYLVLVGIYLLMCAMVKE